MFDLYIYIPIHIQNKYTTLNKLYVCIYIETEKAMAPHSSTLAWKIPWTEEPCRLQAMGSQRIGHD